MLVVREIFTAQPGKASALAKLMKEVGEQLGSSKVRVLTDYVGQFNTVVLETEVASMDDFDKRMEEYSKDPSFKEKMAGYTDLFQSGKREVFKIVE